MFCFGNWLSVYYNTIQQHHKVQLQTLHLKNSGPSKAKFSFFGSLKSCIFQVIVVLSVKFLHFPVTSQEYLFVRFLTVRDIVTGNVKFLFNRSFTVVNLLMTYNLSAEAFSNCKYKSFY